MTFEEWFSNYGNDEARRLITFNTSGDYSRLYRAMGVGWAAAKASAPDTEGE